MKIKSIQDKYFQQYLCTMGIISKMQQVADNEYHPLPMMIKEIEERCNPFNFCNLENISLMLFLNVLLNIYIILSFKVSAFSLYSIHPAYHLVMDSTQKAQIVTLTYSHFIVYFYHLP